MLEETLSPLQQRLVYAISKTLSIERALQRDPKSGATLIADLQKLRSSLEKIERDLSRFEQTRQRILSLASVSQVINSSLELNEVLRIVMDNIVRLTGAERAFLMLFDENGSLRTEIARNWEQESLDKSEIAVSHTIIKRVVSEGKPVLTTNAQEDPRFKGQKSIVLHNLRSILCVPLKVKDRVTGVIYADNRVRTGVFTAEDQEMLVTFANQAAVALENARLFESVKRTLAEVTELKNLLDNVFSSIASGVITADIHDKINLCNQAAAQILGKTREELLGLSVTEALKPISGTLQPHLAQVKSSGKPVVGLEVAPDWPGRGRVFLNINLSPLRDAEGGAQGTTLVIDDITEKRRLQAMRTVFERMVSPKVIEQLDPQSLRPGGRRATVSVIFADIRGFTRFSERLSPEKLVSILNRYLAAAAEAILEAEGTIDKFMGDAVMAWFNAPLPQPDHALRAVKAALGIRERVKKLQDELPEQYRLHFGIGLHVGEAVLGLIGTERRLEYTAIGDSVNTAKRIQENSAADQILISEAAYRAVKPWVVVREVPPLLPKGKSHPLKVYELLDIKVDWKPSG